MSQIVNETATVLAGAVSSKLQQTGAIISQGGTTTAVNAVTVLTSAAGLTAITPGAQTLTALTWASSVATGTVSGGHGYPTGQTVSLTIIGSTPAGYNGTFACTITSSTQFTYPLVSNPGSNTVLPSVTDADVGILASQVTAFFAQNTATAVSILEFGVGDVAHGITALSAFITASPVQPFYIYLMPPGWDAGGTTLAFVNTLVTSMSQTYFIMPVTSGTQATYAGVKSVIMCTNSSTAAAGEQSGAAILAIILNLNPGPANPVPPLCYTFMYGLTAWPVNSSAIPVMETAFTNYPASGAEGGLSNVILKKGVTADGNQINHWYAVDWVGINGHLQLANAIITGSQPGPNPLYYNQNGINRIQQILQTVFNNAVSYGLVGGLPVVNAVPYTTYTAANPTHYALGIYNGLSCTFATLNGFITITFNLFISPSAP